MFRTRIGLQLLLPLLFVAPGCDRPDGYGGTTDRGQLAVVARLIESPSDQPLNLVDVRREEEVSDITEELNVLDEWTVGQPESCIVSDDRMEVLSGIGFATLSRQVEWDAEDVDAILLTLTEPVPQGRRTRMFWSAPGEHEVPARSVEAIEVAAQTVVLRAAGHPNWSGRIGRIRVDVPRPESGSVLVGGFRGVRYRFDAKTLETLQGKDWRVELGDDARPCAVLTVGWPTRWVLEGSPEGELRFGYSIIGSAAAGGRIRVWSTGRGGRRQLLRELDDPGATVAEKSEWKEAKIPLSEVNGLENLEFELAARDAEMAQRVVGVIANPTLVSSKAPVQGPNLVLISLDTLRSDRLSGYGYQTTTSPRLDALAAQEGVLFRNVVAASPRTLPSHVSMMSGLDALAHGVNHLDPAPSSLSMLAEVLRERGFATVATTGGGLMNPEFGLTQGFDEYYHYSGWSGGFGELEAEMEMALDKIGRVSDQRFFVFFHTYEIHDPYHARPPFSDSCYVGMDDPSAREFVFGALPEPRTTRDGFKLNYRLVKWKKGDPISSAQPASAEDLRLVSCLYDTGIRYADSQIGRLLDRLSELGVYDDTMVVVTSDHGESLGEHGRVKHAYLYDSNLLVPLIIKLPMGRFAGSRNASQIGTVDILPTILDYLDVEPPQGLTGRSLRTMMEGQEDGDPSVYWSYAAYENRGVSLRLDNSIKYIYNNAVTEPVHGDEEVYDLRQDPEETDNLAPIEPALRSRLAQQLRSHLEPNLDVVRLEILNNRCDGISGVVRVKNLMTKMKSLGLERGSLEATAENSATISVARGHRLELLIESNDTLDLHVIARGCEPTVVAQGWKTSVDLGKVGAEQGAALLAEGWTSLTSAAENSSRAAAAEVRIWHPQGSGGGGTEEVKDDRVLEQLRALGYVE